MPVTVENHPVPVVTGFQHIQELTRLLLSQVKMPLPSPSGLVLGMAVPTTAKSARGLEMIQIGGTGEALLRIAADEPVARRCQWLLGTSG